MGGRVRSPDPEGSPRRRLRRRRQGGGGRGRHHRFQPHDQHQLAYSLILQRRVLVALAGTGLFIAALDAYVVVTLLPAMMSDIGLTIERLEQATPIVTGFLAGYVVAMPLLGAYSDVRGRIPVYVACIAAFAVGSVMTATAGTWAFAGLPWLVVGRFVQGLGGGGLVPLSLALAADLYRDRSRTLALGSVAALQEAGSVFGPLYGASLAAAAAGLGGWRFVFWLNVPLAAICAAGLVAATRRAELPAREAGSTIDWISALLLGVGLGLLVIALYPDDPEHRPTNALFVPAIIAAALALAAYGWRHVRELEPLTAAVLALTRGQSHGLATSLVVLARTMGMLVGLSALTAFGLYRFHQILGTPTITDPDLSDRIKHLEQLVSAAFLQEYREIFVIAAAMCVVAAVVIALSLRPARSTL